MCKRSLSISAVQSCQTVSCFVPRSERWQAFTSPLLLFLSLACVTFHVQQAPITSHSQRRVSESHWHAGKWRQSVHASPHECWDVVANITLKRWLWTGQNRCSDFPGLLFTWGIFSWCLQRLRRRALLCVAVRNPTHFQNWFNVKSFRGQGDLLEHLPCTFIASLLWTLINSFIRAISS